MNERIAYFIRRPLTIPITVGIVSFGAGVGAGFLLSKKMGKKAELYEIPNVDIELTEDDLKEMKDELEGENGVPQILKIMRDDPSNSDEIRENAKREIQKHLGKSISEVITDENAPEETVPVIVEVDGEQFESEDGEHLKVVGTPPEATPIRRNAFAGSDDHWNYEEEVRNRTTELPYILHKDEFYEDEKNYAQMTLTYYEGDNIMVDEEEAPIYNHERTVGPLRFGHGSGDPKVFYVRNDRLKAEYEILCDSGMYSVEVLGLEIENNQRAKDLRHIHEPTKFRRE